jgi:hypothetical protein
VAFVIIGGIIAWFNMSRIELQLASFHAGFSAHMPAYQPTDYKLGSIHEEHGKISLAYYSGDRHYRITQQASNWNSQTLLDTTVAGASTDDQQVVQSKGRTIYLYEGNNATWVDRGVRYDITGDAYLTREDIIAIVDSM